MTIYPPSPYHSYLTRGKTEREMEYYILILFPHTSTLHFIFVFLVMGGKWGKGGGVEDLRGRGELDGEEWGAGRLT